jgi:L-lactate dehydrogenase complex protein LldG
MHEAYKNLKIKNFALFMAGPSKTADIEQSLVIGAHGAKRCFLYLYKES